MNRIVTSAPGKIMLCGEYVVLDGAPSLCVAINRRASVSIQESGLAQHAITSPGFSDARFLFTVDASGVFDWRENNAERPDFSLLEQVWVALKPTPPAPIDMVLDTQAFADPSSSRKLGLGGSAALTVALSAAIANLQQETADVDLMIESHRQFQDGRGSGADIAASYAGGLIEYRIGSPAMLYPMKWRGDLQMAVLWSGKSVSTSDKLLQFATADDGSNSRQDLAAASTAIVKAWSDSNAEEIMSGFSAYTEKLAEFSNAHDLGIFDGGHAELFELAPGSGVVYKPCGAGGGDVGMVLALSKEALHEFVDIAVARNFYDLDLIIDDEGVTVGDGQT